MDRQKRLEALLDEISRERGVLGAALVSRDGLPVRSTGKIEMSRETFCAMSATVLGAAEIALGELDGGKTQHLVATTDRLKLILVGATRDLLLVASVQLDVPHEPCLQRLQAAAQNVALVVSGG